MAEFRGDDPLKFPNDELELTVNILRFTLSFFLNISIIRRMYSFFRFQEDSSLK